MNVRRIAAAAITAWLISIPFGAFLHHGIFGGVYAANAAAFRTDLETIRRLPVAYAIQLVGFCAAAYLYAGRDSHRGGAVDGLLFGLWLGVLITSFAVVWNYATQPISVLTGLVEVVEYMVASMIYGAIIGMICRAAPDRARA